MRSILTACLIVFACGAASAQAGKPGADAEAAGFDERKDEAPDWSNPFGTPVEIVRFHAAPVYRIKGDNTDPAFGGEIGVSGAFRASDPSLGLFIGYFAPKSSLADGFSYRLIPVTLRVGYDAALTEGGTRFAIAAEGGYAINDFASRPSQGGAINNTYVVGGQIGFKSPPIKRLTASLLFGYQFIKPKITTPIAGGSVSEYRDLSAPFVKLGLEF